MPRSLNHLCGRRERAAAPKALKSKEVIAWLGAIGAEVLPTTPEEFAAFIRAECERWGEVIRRAGMKLV